MEEQEIRGDLGGIMSGRAVKWTAEQLQVIESRGENLLVSAAAGSGKTAVLVERIIRLVTEGDSPLDIDKLLVMTFTNAAAAEMRERIGAAIEKKLAENPDDEHLQIQSTLVHHAQITTIDSFCLHVIREHFNLLDIDPSFRVGDEGEMLLMRSDVMQNLIEDRYADGSGEFERFVETYAHGKSDAGIEDYILQVYNFSQSNPYPESWFEACRAELEIKTVTDDGGELEPWVAFLVEDLKRQAGELALQLTEALSVCRDDEYLCAYVPMLESDVCQLGKVCGANDFAEIYGYLTGIVWERLATVRSKDVDQEKKQYVTGCRDRAKKAVGRMRELYCFAEPVEMFDDMAHTRDATAMLLELAEEFAGRFREKKREKNILDFNDLEHEALRVLWKEENGALVCTEAADELSRQYEQVLVDEYQDSNLVQEALLTAVSGERFGHHNVFMVGDVKQSIYKFRLARPELFLEKYDRYEPYGEGEGSDKKIELHHNFRSRESVLGGINDVFFQIMTRNLGNIRYTEHTALHPGATFAESEEPERLAGIPQLLVVDTGDGALSQMEEDAADYTAKEIEAKLIAAKIREMTDDERGLFVWDETYNGTGGYRPARYRDMVILLRSAAGWTEALLSVLMNEGIPAYAESRTGYFNTVEVETMLSLLSVIDNPMQDIPLAAVLKSPVGEVSDAELAQMMAEYRALAQKGQDRGIYGAVRLAMEKGNEKISRCMKQIERFRQMSTYLSVHELLYRIYEETGYYHYASAMPAGDIRRANLDMLVEKAAEYEKTSYKGLFHFVRSIESLKKYHSDFGEASTVGEEDDTVRIMSIHKSKGLEFPVVFLAGMGKKFNRQDQYKKILIDADLGIGTEYLNLERRLKAPTLKKNVLRRKLELESLGEELRVLYVAMTRAKEQLIMTGTDRYLAKTMEKYARLPLVDGQLPYTILSGAGSYLDWLLMTAGSGMVRIKVTEVPLAGLVETEMKRQVESRSLKAQLVELDLEKEYDVEYGKVLRTRLDYRYPHAADIMLHTKLSVSELKKQGQLTDEAESVRTLGPLDLSWEEWLESRRDMEARILPQFYGSDTAPDGGSGARRGTAYHRAMELLPFHKMQGLDDVIQCLSNMVKEGRFTGENLELIDCRDIWSFLESGLGSRMRLAQAEGRLYKEQQFVMGVPARDMGAGDSDEMVVIQGIIDAYFEEDSQLVVVDYKTDRVRRAATLVEHYERQLDYYGRALTQITGKRVKEKIIYSFALQKEISCATIKKSAEI